jgi:hypothetical protein
LPLLIGKFDESQKKSNIYTMTGNNESASEIKNNSIKTGIKDSFTASSPKQRIDIPEEFDLRKLHKWIGIYNPEDNRAPTKPWIIPSKEALDTVLPSDIRTGDRKAVIQSAAEAYLEQK